eukprot:m.59439 g.59439  ORF g.59439 m.59439 type:complete len:64 (-) comp9464_c0_seq2:3800-3991(-)
MVRGKRCASSSPFSSCDADTKAHVKARPSAGATAVATTLPADSAGSITPVHLSNGTMVIETLP